MGAFHRWSGHWRTKNTLMSSAWGFRECLDKFRCARAWGLRMLPRFLLSDIAAVPRRWRAGRRHRYLMPRSADLFLDENVINGLACTFPPSVAASSVHRALMGAQWLLRPRGKLLTFSSDKWKGNIISERVGNSSVALT